jgi:molybdopterin converting factor small subunit
MRELELADIICVLIKLHFMRELSENLAEVDAVKILPS